MKLSFRRKHELDMDEGHSEIDQEILYNDMNIVTIDESIRSPVKHKKRINYSKLTKNDLISLL